jgi:hypothetical protein
VTTPNLSFPFVGDFAHDAVPPPPPEGEDVPEAFKNLLAALVRLASQGYCPPRIVLGALHEAVERTRNRTGGADDLTRILGAVSEDLRDLANILAGSLPEGLLPVDALRPTLLLSTDVLDSFRAACDVRKVKEVKEITSGSWVAAGQSIVVLHIGVPHAQFHDPIPRRWHGYPVVIQDPTGKVVFATGNASPWRKACAPVTP